MRKMLRKQILLGFALFLIGLKLGSAFFFTIGVGDTKCFHIEQPRDTPIVFAYEILEVDHQVDFGLFYGLNPTSEQLILHRRFEEAVGHIDFTTDESGPYSMCLQQADVYEHATRFKLTINYGYDLDHYEELASEEKFDYFNLEVRKLNDLMDMTINEADYQKHKEVEYHEQTEKMNSAVLWWPVIQIGILLIAGVLQVQHLKGFFKTNKII